MCFAFVPLTDVTVVEEATPDAVAMLQASCPFTVVDFSIDPSVNAFSIGFSHFKIAIVAVACWVPLESFTMTKVFVPLTFILTAISILHHASTMALSINHYAKVDGLREATLSEAF